MTLHYYPASWSQRVRKLCDRQINLINHGLETEAGALRFFIGASVPEIVKNRAVKRFRRMRKKGKIHEDLKLFKKLCPIQAQIYELVYEDKF
jgi:hypothetical protein